MIIVSALMPTTSKRAAFRPRALECFHQQVFPANWEVDHILDEHETNTLGRKINDMTASSTADYLISWDDDDCHSPTRIARQIAPLITGEYGYSGTSQIFYHDIPPVPLGPASASDGAVALANTASVPARDGDLSISA